MNNAEATVTWEEESQWMGAENAWLGGVGENSVRREQETARGVTGAEEQGGSLR